MAELETKPNDPSVDEFRDLAARSAEHVAAQSAG